MNKCPCHSNQDFSVCCEPYITGEKIAETPQFGTVTFFARFLDGNIKKHIYEKSQFEKIDGQWFYVDGIMLKTNRNENCPCGSGNKFKRCCA